MEEHILVFSHSVHILTSWEQDDTQQLINNNSPSNSKQPRSWEYQQVTTEILYSDIKSLHTPVCVKVSFLWCNTKINYFQKYLAPLSVTCNVDNSSEKKKRDENWDVVTMI